MENKFKKWILERGNKEATANNYSRAIHRISAHYSEKTKSKVDIYALTDQAQVSQIAHDYSQRGKFSEFGYEGHSLYRNAIARYSEFFVHHHGIIDDHQEKLIEDILIPEPAQANFAYERDLQTTLCAQVSELFPEYKIFGDSNLGVEYSIAGRRIDVLLENPNNGNLLVVELKSGIADYKVFGQISMYMGLLKQQFRDKDIRGLIIAGSIDKSLSSACETTENITLKTYRMSLELEDI